MVLVLVLDSIAFALRSHALISFYSNDLQPNPLLSPIFLLRFHVHF